MKNGFFLLLTLALMQHSFAQNTEEKKVSDSTIRKGRFKKEKLFTGGGLQLSIANSTFIGGLSPVFGYSVNKLLDVGVGINFSYYSNRHVVYQYYINNQPSGQYFVSDDKEKQTILGPLVFAKFYPVNFLFIQTQGEINFISQKLIYANGSPTDKFIYSVPSLLVGAGYSSGRQGSGDLFYYVSLLFDIAKNKNSPYVEQISNGSVNVLPIVRAGLQIPLFQGKRNR